MKHDIKATVLNKENYSNVPRAAIIDVQQRFKCIFEKKKFDIDEILTEIRTQMTRRIVNESKRKTLNISLLKPRKKTAVTERRNYYSYIPVQRISQKSRPRSFILYVYGFLVSIS